MSRSKRDELLAAVRAHTRRPNATRWALPAEDGMRLCANDECRLRFTPTRPWQTYHSSPCRWSAWQREHRTKRGRTTSEGRTTH